MVYSSAEDAVETERYRSLSGGAAEERSGMNGYGYHTINARAEYGRQEISFP